MIRDDVKALVADKNFATISTLLPSGQIQSHVVWVDCDDDHVVINTEIGLRKFKNVQADPRVTVTIWDRKNPYFFAEVRGRVVQTVTGPEARANIDSLAQKYLDADYPEELIHSERVILKIAPDSQIVFASGMHDIPALGRSAGRNPAFGDARSPCRTAAKCYRAPFMVVSPEALEVSRASSGVAAPDLRSASRVVRAVRSVP